MKKVFVLLLALACLVVCTGCFCGHQWVEASCLEPKTCPLCGKKEGEALGHRWQDATCQAPQTCEVCGESQGEKVDHQWLDATCNAPKTCKWCGKVEGEALEHSWQNATTEAPKTCAACGATEGERIITDERFTTAANQELFGAWETEMTMSGQEMSLAEYVDEVAFVITVHFGEDGNLEIKASFQDMEGFVSNLVAVTQEMIYLQFEGMDITRDEADVMFEDTYGMTIAEYAEGIWTVVDWNAMLAIYADEYVYYAENGSINIAGSWEEEFETSSYTLVGDVLTIVDSDGTTLELTRAE